MLFFVASCVDMLAVGHDDVVAAIAAFGVNGLVLALQSNCYGGCESSEGTRIPRDIEMVPGPGETEGGTTDIFRHEDFVGLGPWCIYFTISL